MPCEVMLQVFFTRAIVSCETTSRFVHNEVSMSCGGFVMGAGMSVRHAASCVQSRYYPLDVSFSLGRLDTFEVAGILNEEDKHSMCSARVSASLFLQQKTLEIDSGNLIFARVQHIYAILLLCTALCQRGQKDATGFYSDIRSA